MHHGAKVVGHIYAILYYTHCFISLAEFINPTSIKCAKALKGRYVTLIETVKGSKGIYNSEIVVVGEGITWNYDGAAGFPGSDCGGGNGGTHYGGNGNGNGEHGGKQKWFRNGNTKSRYIRRV